MSFTVMMDTEEGLLENIVNEVSREDGDQSVISLLSLYRSCTLVNHAFLRAVKEMPSEFDGTVISYEHFASVMFTGGKYIEEEEAEEDAKFIPGDGPPWLIRWRLCISLASPRCPQRGLLKILTEL
tara:strand:- start:1 stop:378 length:378 start_codon:yes stop_codon:yes gene_type:complete